MIKIHFKPMCLLIFHSFVKSCPTVYFVLTIINKSVPGNVTVCAVSGEKVSQHWREAFYHDESCHVVYGVYRSGTVNSKSFVGKVLLRIKRKFELTYAL